MESRIARRHTSSKKNKTDGFRSTPYVPPLRDIIAFIEVMNGSPLGLMSHRS
jgi:hypothetical protein